jgi:DNA-binding response OmpR family regulator
MAKSGPSTARRATLCDVHVLLVEDDDAIAQPLARGLEREGFEVTRVATGSAAIAHDPVDLVLLDLGLPDLDGYEVCRTLRSRSSVPIIVITARGDEVDRVIGLELGADDYLVKPFGFRELVARIRAVTRRALAGAPSSSEPTTVGPLAIDTRRRRVWVGGREVTLTRKEFDLLALLAEDPGATRTRDEILQQVWDPHWYGPTKTLDVHVASLRRKLGDPTLVETVRGVGFRLRTAD